MGHGESQFFGSQLFAAEGQLIELNGLNQSIGLGLFQRLGFHLINPINQPISVLFNLQVHVANYK